MRTRTIYNAMREAQSRANSDHHDWNDSELRGANHRFEQFSTFEAELFRRMDERDALVAPKAPAFLTPERIEQYMAGFSDGAKAEGLPLRADT